jgi:DHA2 family multidrug resistance protein
MGAFQIMLDKGQEEDWFGSNLIVGLAIAAAIGLIAFPIREVLIKEPLVDFRLFRYSTFTIGVFVGGVLGFVLFGSMVLLPLFMQELLGFPAATAGIWSSPRGIGTLIFLPLTGVLLGRRWDPRILLMLGLLVASVSFFSYAGLNLQAGGMDFLLPQIIQGAGLAMVFVPLTTIAMDPIPLQTMGFATSLYSMIRNIGSSIGISFVTTQIARRSQFHQVRLTEAINQYNPAVQRYLSTLDGLTGTGSSAAASTRSAGLLYGQVMRQASAMSFLDLFHLLGILFLVVAPIVWIMRRPRQKPVAQSAH